MTLRQILTYPNPLLKKKSAAISKVQEELRTLAQDMLETMYNSRGIGLAAPQVGELVRLIVIDTRSQRRSGNTEGPRTGYQMTPLELLVPQPLILMNPEITSKEGKTQGEEGCLSVPSFFETVTRSEKIWVRALNSHGKKVEFETDGLLSICIQHEIDHLDGKLFIDRLSTIKSSRIKSKIKKFGYPAPEREEDESSNPDSEHHTPHFAKKLEPERQ